MNLAFRVHNGPNYADTRRSDAGRRKPEIRVIQQVESLRAKLQPESFAKCKCAGEANIYIRQAGTAKNISSRIAEANAIPNGERRGIEPALHISLVVWKRTIPKPIRTRGGSRRTGVRIQSDCEGLARLRGGDSGKLPTTPNCPQRSRNLRPGDLPETAKHNPLPDVEAGTGALPALIAGVLRTWIVHIVAARPPVNGLAVRIGEQETGTI